MKYKANCLKYSLMFLIIATALNAKCQNNHAKYFPYYFDHKIIKYYQDSLKNVKEYYLTLALLTKKQGKEITYFIWIENNKMNVIQITDSTISKPILGTEQNFISKTDFLKIFIRESEDNLKFMPPANPLIADIAFVEFNKKMYVVESVEGIHYALDKSNNKARAAFFAVLLKDLEPLQEKWLVYKPYKRLPKH
ncbi:hypothetical protein LRS06_03515 [Hymenobacter sp. J193]|uniref:hypothetical protein n=1 Tax=Hymenobacter sp. J193 TaxID=2898429 RepID=UPI0021514CC3|nr:hypothetical protein [Hymenobacter sp. J193]MCR5886855.1 hypothetical protein [Hymenobacter sp. J193]